MPACPVSAWWLARAASCYSAPTATSAKALRDLLLPAVAAAPFAGREFDTKFWQTRFDEYKTLLGQTDGLAGKVSKSVSQKDTAKLELRRVLQAVVYALKANYPDTFEAELRSWSFRKENY